MEKYLNLIKKSEIFRGIGDAELLKLLKSLNAAVCTHEKGETVMHIGDFGRMGIVLSGAVSVVSEDYNGNSTIISSVCAPGMFAEAFVCAGEALPFNVTAICKSEILLFKPENGALSDRLLKITARKNLILTRKINILSKRTIRERLTEYLNFEAQSRGKSSFEIPYDRQALARYLCVDRSALSAEIGKLEKEGVIRSAKNFFEILQKTIDK